MVLQALLLNQGPLKTECQAPSDPRHSLETSTSPTGVEAVHSAEGALAVEQFQNSNSKRFFKFRHLIMANNQGRIWSFSELRNIIESGHEDWQLTFPSAIDCCFGYSDQMPDKK